jgi:hypothetical protein
MSQHDAEHAAFVAELRRYLDDKRFGDWLRMLGPGEPAILLRQLWLVNAGVFERAGVEPPPLSGEWVSAAVAAMNRRLRAASDRL